MKRLLFLIGVMFLYALNSIGQQTYILKGVVVDSTDGEPLIGATVTVDYGDQAQAVNVNGEFAFVLQRKTVSIVARFVGYIPYRRTLSLPITDLKIQLSRVDNQLQEIIVSGEGSESVNRPILGVTTLNVKTIEKLPTALGEVDILKGLQMLPGVSSVGEASNGVNVRGGTTDQNLMLLEDAPIFNPTHMFGLFSAFPSDAISSFDLYKGNVPARYGGRAAAVLDIKFTNPSLDKFKMEGGVSVVSNKLKMDIPLIKNKMALMVAGRGSFNDFLFPLISPKLDGLKAKFGDGAAKLFYKVNQKNTLSLNAYYSYDFFQTQLLGSVENINATASQFEYSTMNYSGKWFYNINNKLNLQTILVTSKYQPNILLPELNVDNKIAIKQQIDYNQVKSNLNYFNGKHSIEGGIDVIKYKVNPGFIDPGNSTSVLPISTPVEFGTEMGLGIEDQIKFSNKLTVSAGLRYSMFLFQGPTTVNSYRENEPREESTIVGQTTFGKGKTAQQYGGPEPRIGVKYSLNSNSSLKFGYNLARQYLQIVSNTTTPIPTSRWKLSDKHLQPQVSQLYSLGYFYDFTGSVVELSAEAYYRNTNNIVDYKPGADFLLTENPETEILQGINKSYGAELMVSKKKGEFTGWINYTYARSLNLVDEGPFLSQRVNVGQWYASNYDRPHTVNASLVINQGKHHDFSFNFTYSTGRPYTSPQGFIKFNQQTLPFYFNRNNDRLPDYHRLDFAWNIYNPRIKEKKFKGNWAFSVYNLYGRKNAYSIFFKPEKNILKAYQLTIFGAPIVSLAYKFTFN